MNKKYLTIFLLLIFIPLNAYATTSEFDYIIYKNSNITYALNTLTGNVDYSGNTSNVVFQNAFKNGHKFLIEPGTYVFNSYVIINSNSIIQGDSNVILQRNYSSNTLIYFSKTSSNLSLSQLIVDGNYKLFPNSSFDLDLEGNNVNIRSLTVGNFSHVGLAFEGTGSITDSQFFGNHDNTNGFCIHAAEMGNRTKVRISDNYFSTCELNAIIVGGNSIITNNYFYNNTFAAAGGVIDLVGSHVIVTDNIFDSASRTHQGSIEVWSGCNIISNNIFIYPYTGIYYDRTNNCSTITGNNGY